MNLQATTDWPARSVDSLTSGKSSTFKGCRKNKNPTSTARRARELDQGDPFHRPHA